MRPLRSNEREDKHSGGRKGGDGDDDVDRCNRCDVRCAYAGCDHGQSDSYAHAFQGDIGGYDDGDGEMSE